MNDTDYARVLFRAKRSHEAAMFRASRVTGVGIGERVVGGKRTSEPCVKVFVTRKVPLAWIPPAQRVPAQIRTDAISVPTDVEEISALTAPPAHDGLRAAPFGMRVRPLAGGTSGAAATVPLGTIGVMARDVMNPHITHALSCNHVFTGLNAAAGGTPVVQPSPADGGWMPRDTVGALSRFVPLYFGGGINEVDCAVAAVAAHDPVVAVVGAPAAVRRLTPPRVGEPVMKVGRTTGLTAGTVVAVNVSLCVPYLIQWWTIQGAFFVNQIVTENICAFGDSGSLLLDVRRQALGLLFAGSPTHTVFSPIVDVERRLGIFVDAPSA